MSLNKFYFGLKKQIGLFWAFILGGSKGMMSDIFNG